MADALPESTHFGFTRLGEGEPLSKNGWSFTDLDRLKLDNLLFAALTHRHDGAPALGDPTDPPTLTSSPTDGHLPAATTYFYRCSFVDQYGLETAASPEETVTTPDPLAPPTAPAAATEPTLGTVLPGVYSYLITYTDAYGGETTPSALNNIDVVGGATNRIRLTLPDLPPGATGYNLYRSRPGQSAFYYLGATSATIWYDNGQVEDQSIQAPTVNTTNAANSVTITIPLGFIPDGCVAWRIYRASTSGGYDGNSLVHEVIEGVTDTSTVPRTFWVDTGDGLTQGFPQNQSSTVPSGSLLSLNDLQGSLPLSVTPRGSQCITAFGPGVIDNAQILTITESPTGVQPVRFTAYFKTPPNSGTTVRLVAQDTANHFVALSCTATPQAGDPAGYYRIEFPLVAAAVFDAVSGTRSSGVALVTDVLSATGQAIPLGNNGDSVTFPLGVLDSGDYTTYTSIRPLTETPAAADVQVQVIRTDTNDLLTSDTFQLDTVSGGYRELQGVAFTAPGGVALNLVVSKATAATNAYNVEQARFTAVIPTLNSGRLVIQAFVDNNPTTASDVNIALWF